MIKEIDRATKTVVIVGNGMVSHRLCEKLLEFDRDEAWEVIVYGEEQSPAYDRVQLSAFFSGCGEEELCLADASWYADNGIQLRLGTRIDHIDRDSKSVLASDGQSQDYDALVLATGSYPFVPPIPGTDKLGVFVYRTLDDLKAIQAYAKGAHRAAVIGGGLLGLEAAKACVDMTLETHVIEFAERLMPRQLDDEGSRLLQETIADLGVHIHLNMRTKAITGYGKANGLLFADKEHLPVDMIIISAGIRPRDELAKASGLTVGERGGVVVDNTLKTSDDAIYCVGEAALYEGMIYGLVAPGYDMAEAVAARLTGDDERHFTGADMSTKLKLLGVDVASIGDPFAAGDDLSYAHVCDNESRVYKKIVYKQDRSRLLGAILVGDASAYGRLLQLARSGKALPEEPASLIVSGGGDDNGLADMADDDQVCSCNNVSKGDICKAIAEQELTDLGTVKACTKAGTGCGGCLPMVSDIFAAEMAKAGVTVNTHLCPHFAYSRRELFDIVKVNRIKTFDQLLAQHGTGTGCEVCKPTFASIIASLWNEHIVEHDTIQDTNDRFLANIQRTGLYSVVPRVPGGEITPDKLIVLGEVAKRYNLYTKITGGQRIDLFGARVNDLPAIWEALIDAGFESGHAYGKAVRTVKSCVGKTWCRFGVQDSTAFAIRIEERYRGIRAPHKLKSAVSGCVRECAEAQSKDFGIIATEKGWNLYVCGNGGAKPRHADLLAADLDDETCIRYIDRFLMYYIHTADKLTRTSVWLEKLEGGLGYLRDVVVHDKLGICAQLEADMDRLVNSYKCEWTEVVRNPEKRRKFAHFANCNSDDSSVAMVEERGQQRPRDWPTAPLPAGSRSVATDEQWITLGEADCVPMDGGVTLRHGKYQFAIFRFQQGDRWYACQNLCPHKRDMVLARGLTGDVDNIPKVACPLHKKTFSLETGEGLNDPSYEISTFPVRVVDGKIQLRLPPEEVLAQMSLCHDDTSCAVH